MKLFSGYSDFGSVIENTLDFVDKSLFIEDVIQDANQVLLITRPRRFGKTFNLSMLKYFFAAQIRGVETKALFEKLKITQKPEAMRHQGQHPVISISLKDLAEKNYEGFCQKFASLIGRVYQEHVCVLEGDHLQAWEKKKYQAILNETATKTQLQDSLRLLTEYLHRCCGQKPVILMDEYDTPIQSGYMNNYYDQAVDLMRGFLSPALKDNDYLYKAVLTGILRVSKESLFSGLNNVEVHSVLGEKYSEYFGFTEGEVKTLFDRAGLSDRLEEAKRWYNGYQIGSTLLYNPWSIVHCINARGKCQPYWVNTSGNDLVNELLIGSSVAFKHDFEHLLAGHSIEVSLNEHFVFPELKKNESAIWSLLLMTGYLKVVAQHITEDGLALCQLEIPNLEVKSLYRRFIKEWLSPVEGVEGYNHFLNHLLKGEVDSFTTGLERILLQIVSVHDVAREPEAFYQGLMLGFTVGLNPAEYEIKSNRESGLGRYDIVIIPKDAQALGIILELKSVKTHAKGDALMQVLEQESLAALAQIEQKTYVADLMQRGHGRILKLGLAFAGKRVHVESTLQG